MQDDEFLIESIESRYFLAGDYMILKQWWKKWNRTAPALEYLPTSGIIVTVNDTYAAAGFLYGTDSLMCLFDWMVSNPFIHKGLRSAGIDRLISDIIKEAKKQGYELIYASKNSAKLISRLKNLGFCGDTKGNEHLFYGV